MTKSLVRVAYNAVRSAGNRVNTPVPFANQYNRYNGQLYGSGLQDRFTQLQAMQGTGTLFAIIQLLSTGAQAMGGWKMLQTTQDGRVRYSKHDKGSDQRPEILRHPALELWNQPNNFMTGEHFREIGWQFMELVGEWYWVLTRGDNGRGIPTEMWPVRPDRMEPVPSRKNFLDGWVYTGPNGEQVPLLASEVIQLRYPNPLDMYRGMSPVQSLLADIDSAKYTAEWSRNFFLNSATPGGIVTFAKRLSDVEFREFVSRWREQHQGVARGHRVGVLEQGATWDPNTYTMADMQFVDLRNLNRDVIREAYRIHKSMLGNSDDVNRANAETAEQVHVQWHEIPRLMRQRTVLNRMFLPMYGDTSRNREFDYNDPTPSSATDANEELTAKSKAAAILSAAGWHPDDILEVVGLPAMRWIGPPASAQGEAGGTPQRQTIGQGTANMEPRPSQVGETPDVTPVGISDSLAMEFAGIIKDSFEIIRLDGKELELA